MGSASVSLPSSTGHMTTHTAQYGWDEWAEGTNTSPTGKYHSFQKGGCALGSLATREDITLSTFLHTKQSAYMCCRNGDTKALISPLIFLSEWPSLSNSMENTAVAIWR